MLETPAPAAQCNVINNVENGESDKHWIKSKLYELQMRDKQVLLSETCWLNDNLMDAAQALICKALGVEGQHQSVLNCQKLVSPYFPVDNEHIQLMHDGTNHWLLTVSSSGRVQVCDSLRTSITRVTRKCIQSLYKNCKTDEKVLPITLLPVQKQPCCVLDRDETYVLCI